MGKRQQSTSGDRLEAGIGPGAAAGLGAGAAVELLDAALRALPPGDHCFEFRHPTWFADDVYALLEERGAGLALGDDKRRPLPDASPAGPLAYLRLHYGSRGRDGNCSDAELDRRRRRIAAWRSRRPVFAYLNNDCQGFAPRNARKLRAGLS